MKAPKSQEEEFGMDVEGHGQTFYPSSEHVLSIYVCSGLGNKLIGPGSTLKLFADFG